MNKEKRIDYVEIPVTDPAIWSSVTAEE